MFTSTKEAINFLRCQIARMSNTHPLSKHCSALHFGVACTKSIVCLRNEIKLAYKERPPPAVFWGGVKEAVTAHVSVRDQNQHSVLNEGGNLQIKSACQSRSV